MRDFNEFWLNVQRLAESYEAAGFTTEERTEQIVGQFNEMASLAQREVLRELCRLMVHLPDVYTVVAAAANDQEKKKGNVSERAATA